MRQIPLPGYGLRLSRFVFACASLFNAGGAQRRRDLLAEAADCGFSHFDTGPSCGFGMAERDLAPVAKAHGGLTVTSKAVLFAPGGEDGSTAAIFLPKALGKLAPALSRAQVDFSLARAKISLEASPRRLGRERLDLFLPHAPRIDLVATDEWLGWLTSLAEQGRIGAFGLAVTRVDDALDFLSIQYARTASTLARRTRRSRARAGAATHLPLYRGGARLDPLPEILKQALRRNPPGALVWRARSGASLFGCSPRPPRPDARPNPANKRP